MKKLILPFILTATSPGLLAERLPNDVTLQGFNYPVGIDSPIPCNLNDIKSSFPNHRIEQHAIHSIFGGIDKDGFIIYRTTTENNLFTVEELFTIECVLRDHIVIDDQHIQWAKEMAFPMVSYIGTENKNIEGPLGSFIGKTTYAEVKDFPWNSDHVEIHGCSPVWENPVYRVWCAGPRFDMMFALPEKIAKQEAGTSDELLSSLEQAVLTKMYTYTGNLELEQLPDEVMEYVKSKL